MIDNEKLIEEAAKALTALTDAEWEIATAEGTEHLAGYFDAARRVLVVFEKAHPPTDDEREALVKRFADLIFAHGLRAPDSTIAVIAFKEVSAGFRRSEVPEPIACPGCHGLKGAHFSTCPEAQGEPSDAQALENFLGKLAGDGAYTLDFTSAASLHGHIVSLLRRDIATLRAAGGVEGEPSDARGIIARALMGEARMDTFSAWNLADDVVVALRAAGATHD